MKPFSSLNNSEFLLSPIPFFLILTIFLAKNPKNSMAEVLVLQFLSIAKSFKAGNKEWERVSRSRTFVIASRCLKRLTLTSELSSLNKSKKTGKI